MGTPSPSDAKRKAFRRIRLFEVTGRLIGMLMIYGGGDGRGMIFDRGFLGDRANNCITPACNQRFFCSINVVRF